MGDFDKFLKNVKEGNLGGVTDSFHVDFLEKKDAYKLTPICYACSRGHIKIVEFLIDRKCNIEFPDPNGLRPIHRAVNNAYVNIVELLVRNGCKLQCKTNNGETPLDLATKQKHQTCIDFLNEAVKWEQIFVSVGKKECPNLKGLKTVDVVMREQPKTGLSFLEVAHKAGATEVLRDLLDKSVEDEEIPKLRQYIEENHLRPERIKLIKELFLYRCIRYPHAKGFDMLCLPDIVNGPHKIVLKSFLEIAVEHGTAALIKQILSISEYNKEEWNKAKDLANRRDDCQRIKDAISEKERSHTSKMGNDYSDSVRCDQDLQRSMVKNTECTKPVESLKTALSHTFSDKKQLDELKKWFKEKNVIPRGNLSRCRDFDGIFYEIMKTEQYDLVIEFCQRRLAFKLIGNIMDCWEKAKGSGTRCQDCKRLTI